MSARQALQPLEVAFFFDSHESDGRIVFRPRGSVSSAIALTPDDLVETGSNRPLLQLTRAQETDLPTSSTITYVAATGDYAQASSHARRTGGASGRASQAALGLVLEPSDGDEIAERLLFDAWAARDRAHFSLPPSRLAIEPGDTLVMTANERSQTLRVTEVGEHGARDIEARSMDPAAYVPRPARQRNGRPAGVRATGAPLMTYLDCPPPDGEPAHAGLVAATQEPWPGDVAVFRSPDVSGFTLSTLLSRPATTALTQDTFQAGVHGRLDRASRLVVTLDRGSLTSVTSLALLAGASLAAVERAPGAWELLQFQTAALIGPRTYALTNLLRGLRGTEHAEMTPAGSRFILIDAAVRPLDMTVDDVGLSLNWRAGPARADIGDPAYITTQKTFTGTGLAPLSPVHARATRNTSGDVALSWIRRTRAGGDSWENTEVPLGETLESYAVDILDGILIRRVLTSSNSELTYSAADQIADFGSPQSTLSVRIAQVSPSYGRGAARTLTL